MSRYPVPRRSLAWVSACAVTLAAISPTIYAAPVISEFLARNDTGLLDDDGERYDWIELHNPDAAPVSLDGYYLADSPDDLTEWRLPAVTLAPGAHLVVFASEKDRSDPSATLHTNFKLSGGGEFLGLIAPDGTTIVHAFEPEFPAQEPDVSYGLAASSDKSNLGYFATPTPGALNPPNFTSIAETVAFSNTTGSFTAPFSLSLSGATGNRTIRYTTNRAVPTATSTAYTGPVAIPAENTQIRAAVFAGTESGPVTTHTFLYLDDSDSTAFIGTTVREFTSDLPIVVLDNFGRRKPDNDTEMVWTIFEPKVPPGGGEARASMLNAPDLATRGSMKVRGSSTASFPKYSLSMESWDEFDDDKNVSPLGLPSESDWVLSGRYQFDQALMRNEMIYSLSNDLGRTAMRTRFVEVFMSTDSDDMISTADYFGVYSIIEKIKRDADRIDVQPIAPSDDMEPEITGGYMFKNDRLDPGDRGFRVRADGRSFTLAWVEPKEEDVTRDQSNWLSNNFDEMAEALDEQDGINPDTKLHFSEYLDVDAWIDHHWLNTLTKNVDGFRLSGYYYKDRLGPIVAAPIWDFDRTMGSTDGRDRSPSEWDGTGDSSRTWYDARYPWFGQLLGYSAESQQFPAVASSRPDTFQEHADRWFELRQSTFSIGHIHGRIDEFAEEISEAADRNFDKWRAVRPRGGFSGAVDTLKDWLAERVEWIDEQYPALPTFTPTGGPVAAGTVITASGSASTIYATTDGADPRAPGGEPSPSAIVASSGADFIPIVAEDSPCRYLVPTGPDDAPGTSWTEPAFADSTWNTGILGLGFEPATADDYAPLIKTDLGAVMGGVNATAYVRVPFTIDGNPSEITQLMLEVICDDGFIAYLNGTQIGDLNPPSDTPTWDSNAGGSRRNSDVLASPVVVDATPFKNLIQQGENMLAFHFLNISASSTDAVLAPTLKIGFPLDSEPLTIQSSAVVTGRTRGDNSWGAPSKGYYFVGETPASAANLVVSEIMYHPSVPSAAEIAAGFDNEDLFEYIELQNISSTQISLLGTHFTEGLNFSFETGVTTSIASGGVVLVVADEAAFEARYGGNKPVVGTFVDTQLSNSGETITLEDYLSAPVKSFAYNDKAPWPTEADGEGYSLELRSPATNPDPALPGSWQASANINGSPGTGAPIGGDSAFSQWIIANNLESSDGDNDDDGADDLVEYVFGTDPNSAASGLGPDNYLAGTTEIGGSTYLTLTVTTSDAATGTTQQPQFSTDLQNWTQAGIIIVGTPTSAGGFTTITYRTPATISDEESAFLRYRVTIP